MHARRGHAPAHVRSHQSADQFEAKIPCVWLRYPLLEAIDGYGIYSTRVEDERKSIHRPPVGLSSRRLVGHQLVDNVRPSHGQIVVVDDGGLAVVLCQPQDWVHSGHNQDVVELS